MSGPGTMGRGLPSFLGVWTTMMAAMMLPAVAPVGALYARSLEARSRGVTRVLRTGALVAGYLAAWATFGLAAFAFARGAGELASRAPDIAPWVAAVLLGGAGLYQLTPLKDRCLSHCRSPLGFLLHFGGYTGRLRDFRAGIYHGGYCVGCCWGLMIALLVLGMMSIAWMAALAGVVLVEKTWRHGKAASVVFGVALVALACFVPAHPGLAPGLHAAMTMG
jgi:predicted metal-binding membrane protein